MRAAARHVRRALLWAAVVCLLMTAAWAGSEARDPGRQYPHPFWSVLVVSVTMGPAFYAAWCAITASRRAKKAGR